MKKKIRPYLIMFIIAIVAGTFISTWSSLSNVSACLKSPGCVDQGKQPRGKLTIHSYGFPAAYKQTATFNPINDNENSANYAGYAEAKADIKPTSVVNIAINIVFWFSLLYAMYSLGVKFKTRT